MVQMTPERLGSQGDAARRTCTRGYNKTIRLQRSQDNRFCCTSTGRRTIGLASFWSGLMPVPVLLRPTMVTNTDYRDVAVNSETSSDKTVACPTSLRWLPLASGVT